MSTTADHDWVSARAVAWVIHEAPVPADLAFTLTVIAARCDEHGRGSYQSTATIAEKTGKSPKQAQRDVVRLRELGLVVLGDQSLVEHLPPGQRPIVYDVPLHVRGPKPVKESRNKAGGKKDPGETPPMDGTPPTQGTPPTDGVGTPPIQGIPTPPMDGGQTTLLKNPMNNPSLSGPARRIADAVDATEAEAREMIEIIQRENRPRSLPAYVAALAANGDLAALLDRVREQGPAAAKPSSKHPTIAELRAAQAVTCPHGTPGGDVVCALCRRGAGPVDEAGLRATS